MLLIVTLGNLVCLNFQFLPLKSCSMVIPSNGYNRNVLFDQPRRL